MKFCKIIAIVLILFLQILQAQDIKLNNIPKPGEISSTIRTGIVLGENLIGSYKVVFLGNAPGIFVPTLSREEISASGSGKGSFDKLATQYSGKIYSSNIAEPFIFKNKSPEELIQMEICVFPIILEKQYTLFMDIEVQAFSKSVKDNLSDDAGEYVTTLTVKLIKL